MILFFVILKGHTIRRSAGRENERTILGSDQLIIVRMVILMDIAKEMHILFAQSFNNLLSGSYGLALGSNLTNADTAVLAQKFIRSGNYLPVLGSWDRRGSAGRLWTITAYVHGNACDLYHQEQTLSSDDNAGKYYGFSVSQESFCSSSFLKLWVDRGEFDERRHASLSARSF